MSPLKAKKITTTAELDPNCYFVIIAPFNTSNVTFWAHGGAIRAFWWPTPGRQLEQAK
jgi:hypothetical protein